MFIQSKGTVSLDFYKEEYKSKLSHYHLSKEQIRYAPLPLNAILKCENDNTRYPIVILCNGVPAGFLVLHGWEGVKAYSNNKDAILIRGYSVDTTFQGKGIGKKSLLLLDSFVKKQFPSKREIILAVNHKNTVAQYVYKKGGYIDSGVRVMGRKGELFILHKDLI
ncbi:GNAT family N-acetyltransferase [Virgibacillus sp. L01]|uniref:GNAT family N-acetyltransferase n=1 Tax=Virgibacillus sp. L01 TaxID=3457429 RepID=UPI003FD48917